MLRRYRPPLRAVQEDEICGRTRSPPGGRTRRPGLPRPSDVSPRSPRSRPTPTGRLVTEFLNGRVPAFVDTTLNVVHVDDLATGHLLALERGAVGRSYIVGGENMSMGSFLARLAACTGLPTPRMQVPRGVALAVGALSQLVEGRLLRREPSVALESARMSTTNMMFDDTRARRELGYSTAPRSGGARGFGPVVRHPRLRQRTTFGPDQVFCFSLKRGTVLLPDPHVPHGHRDAEGGR